MSTANGVSSGKFICKCNPIESREPEALEFGLDNKLTLDAILFLFI